MTDTVVLNAFKVPKSKVSKETQQVMPQVEKVKAHDNTENVEGLSPSDLKDKCPMCGSHLAVGSGKKEKKPRVKLTQEEKAEREAKKEKAKLELETKKAKKAEKSANAKAREPSSYFKAFAIWKEENELQGVLSPKKGTPEYDEIIEIQKRFK